MSRTIAETTYVSVPGPDDDSGSRYPRPDILEISRAHAALRELESTGALDADAAAHVRVLLAVVGRLGAAEMAEAFPVAPPALTIVGEQQ